MPRRKHDPATLASFIPAPAETKLFINEFGEQWCFTFDPATGRGMLLGDELGGDHVPIVNGVVTGGLLLGADEYAWLDQCWRDATGTPLVTKNFVVEVKRAIAEYVESN